MQVDPTSNNHGKWKTYCIYKDVLATFPLFQRPHFHAFQEGSTYIKTMSKPRNFNISIKISCFLETHRPTPEPPCPKPSFGHLAWPTNLDIPLFPIKTNQPPHEVNAGFVRRRRVRCATPSSAPGFVVAPRGAPPPTVTRVERVEPCWVRSERCPFLEEVKKARSVGGRETVEEPFLLSP